MEEFEPIRLTRSRKKPTNILEMVLFGALLFFVSISALPLGSNSPLPAALLGVGIAAILVSWAAMVALDRISLHAHTANLKWPAFLYLAVCFWVLLQWAPVLPAQFSDPIWASTNSLLGTELRGHISVNPTATLTGLMNLITYGSVFWLTFQFARTLERAWTIVHVITWVGCAYAIYGIVIYMSGNGWILIYPKKFYWNSLTGTFVNRNSFATFAGLTLLCAVTTLADHIRPFLALKHPPKAKLVIIVEELVAKSALKTFAVLSIAIALLLSNSRAGVGSSLIGLVAILFIFLAQQKLKKSRFAGIFLVTIICTSALFMISGNSLSKRLEVDKIDTSIEFRSYLFGQTWDAILSSPLSGTGFGTYADVIPAYKGNEFGSALQRWDKAHNTYLENALELGIPADIVLNLAIGWVALFAARGVAMRRRDKTIPALGVGAAILVCLHSLVDFSIQIPAISILFACIMGVAVSQSWSLNTQRTSRAERHSQPSSANS